MALQRRLALDGFSRSSEEIHRSEIGHAAPVGGQTLQINHGNETNSTPGIRQIDFRVEAGGVTAVFSCGPGKLTIEFVVNEYLPSPLLMNINGNEQEDH